MEDYKKRIGSYDALVNKLYRLLEERLSQRVPEEVEKEFNQAITHYEQKMLSMSEQILALRMRDTQADRLRHQAEDAALRVDALQRETTTYQAVAAELQG